MEFAAPFASFVRFAFSSLPIAFSAELVMGASPTTNPSGFLTGLTTRTFVTNSLLTDAEAAMGAASLKLHAGIA